MSNESDTVARRPAREPLFNVPWTILVLIGVLAAAHGLRKVLGLPPDAFGFVSDDMAAGRWSGLVTHIFTHGGWTHLLMNSVAILAFGPPVARLMGEGVRGAAAFFSFFLICGFI